MKLLDCHHTMLNSSIQYPVATKFHAVCKIHTLVFRLDIGNLSDQYIRMVDPSSTKIISPNSSLGDLLITECRVLSSVDHASLWKQITTDAFGRVDGYLLFLHLK